MSNLIETLRKITVERLFTGNAFSSAWSSQWKALITGNLSSPISGNDILDLGDYLGTVFLSTRTAAARSSTNSQAGASDAGTAWESLICWYLNLCTIGTRVVAFRPRSLVATPFRDALAINYGTTNTNSESDLIVLIFPNHANFTSPLRTVQFLNASGQPINLYINSRLVNKRLVSLFNSFAANHFSDFGLSVIQCKTNWNENAQIPMLWDLVYNARTFMAGSNISIGINNHHISNLNRFSYSFITVPTNNLTNYHPNKMEVKRVTNLSGGNFWGFPSRAGVAFSIKEIFHRNFSTGFENLRAVLDTHLLNLRSTYSYFDL